MFKLLGGFALAARQRAQSDGLLSCPRNVSGAARYAVCVAALAVLSIPSAWSAEPRVPYVPTPQEVVERMLEIAKVGPS